MVTRVLYCARVDMRRVGTDRSQGGNAMLRSSLAVALRRPGLAPRSPVVRILVALTMALIVLATGTAGSAVSPDVVISEVYGGGGNSGATFTNDFIELYNRGAAPVNLAGWSVQYASAAGTTWQVT